MRYFFSLLCISFCIGCVAESHQFDDYAVELISMKPLATITDNTHPFTQRLQSELGSQPNYAGKYVLTYWGCGTACQVVAAIDTDTGNVHYIDSPASNGVCFQLTSRLLIVNPMSQAEMDEYGDEFPSWYYLYYYEITEEGFVLIEKTKKGLDAECENY